MKHIYFDYAATTPVDKVALKADHYCNKKLVLL